METFDDAMNLWRKTGYQNTSPSLSENEVLFMVQVRIKKQKKTIAQYTLASWVWQFMFYVLTVNLIVRAGGSGTILLTSLAGIAIYIPFTVAYARFCSRFITNSSKRGASIESINLDLKNQYQNLKSFFTFKKKFDLIGIPVTGIFIVVIFEALDFIPQLSVNPVPGITGYAIYLTAFIAAIYSENRKRFVEPLVRLQGIIDDLAEEAKR